MFFFFFKKKDFECVLRFWSDEIRMFAYFQCTHAVKTFFDMSRGNKTVEAKRKLLVNVLPA